MGTYLTRVRCEDGIDQTAQGKPHHYRSERPTDTCLLLSSNFTGECPLPDSGKTQTADGEDPTLACYCADLLNSP
ncbi:unnamed protein product [Lota lota]